MDGKQPKALRVSHPAVTALVVTRNRGRAIVMALRSILANTHQSFELIIVDQSTNDETSDAVQPFLGDARLRYIRSNTIGAGAAKNVGLKDARGDIVALTDDDCVVDNDWLEKMADVFARHPAVAVAYCNVEPAPCDGNAGFIPSYVATTNRLMTSMRDWCAPHGIGAGMAMRREFIERIGGYDELFGPGGRLGAADDSDMALRALATRRHVYHTRDTKVVHFGFRTWREGRMLTQRDCIGLGAGYAKLIKCGHWKAGLPWTYELATLVLVPTVQSLIRGKKPPVLVRSLSLMQGFWDGLRTPVDPLHLLFRPESDAE